MRGVVFTGERRLELMQFPDPTPDTHDVVIEMKASGMCGIDLHQYRRPKGQPQTTGIPMKEGPVIKTKVRAALMQFAKQGSLTLL